MHKLENCVSKMNKYKTVCGFLKYNKIRNL